MAFAAALILLVGVPTAGAAEHQILYVSASAGMDGPSCGAKGSPCATISQAVANATSSDTIVVAAGTYDEQVTIAKSLTLDGAQAGNPGSASRVAESPASESVVTGGNVFIAAPDVTLDGFSFDYPGNQVCVACSVATVGSASSVTIEDNVFSGYQPDSFGDYRVTSALGVNAAPDTVITGNYFTSPGAGYPWLGVGAVQFFNGGCSGTVIGDNSFYAAAADGLGDIFFWCDQQPMTSPVMVSGNRDVHTTTDNGEDFAVFTLMGGPVNVTGNRVTMASTSGTAIYFSRAFDMGAVDISGNSVTGSPHRAVKISGNADAPGPFTITGNDFSGNAVGVYADHNSLASGATVVVHGNNLSDESAYGVYDNPNSGGSIDATANWWGCAAGPGEPGCSTVSGSVTYSPWQRRPG